MKNKTTKKEEKQIVEIHIYIHQNNPVPYIPPNHPTSPQQPFYPNYPISTC
jgi:hypothetical protein